MTTTCKKFLILMIIACMTVQTACFPADKAAVPESSSAESAGYALEREEYEHNLWEQYLFYLAWINPVETAATSDMDNLSVTQYCLKLMHNNGLSFPRDESNSFVVPLDTMQEYAEKYLGISEYLPASLPTVPVSGGLAAAFDRQNQKLYVYNDKSLSGMEWSTFVSERFRPGGITDMGGGMISARVEFLEPGIGPIKFIDYVFDASDPENPVFISSAATWLIEMPTLTGEYRQLPDYNYYPSEYLPDGVWLTVRYVPYMMTLSLVDMQSGYVIEMASHEYSSGPEYYDMSPETIFTPNAIVVKLEDGLRLFGYDLSDKGFIPLPAVLLETGQLWDYAVSPDLKTIAFIDEEGAKTVPLDGAVPPRLILAHPKIAHGEDEWTSEILGHPCFLLNGEVIACYIHFEGRMKGRFFVAGLSGENGRWYDTDKDVPWYKNFHIYASDEWLVTPRSEGNLAAVSLLTGETRIIGNESADAERATRPDETGRYLAFTKQEGNTIRLYLYDWDSGEAVYTGFSVTDGGDARTSVYLGAVDESGRVFVSVYDGYMDSRILVSPVE